MATPFAAPFSDATHADWLSQLRKDLKDNDVYDSLRWQSPEGFVAEPYHSAHTLTPAQLSDQQRVQKNVPGWFTTPSYTVATGEEAATNARLRDALRQGADALLLHVSPDTALPRLLDGIKLSDTPVFFQLQPGAGTSVFMQRLRQLTPYQIRGGVLPPAGTLPTAALTDLLAQTQDSPAFRPIGISGHDFQAAGATATQELAFTLARTAEAYAQLEQAGTSVGALGGRTVLSLSVGTSYFMEMAKLRAMRVLLTRRFPRLAAQSVFIHGQTGTFYEAAATPYTNLLRATTEAMAAVMGGADALTVRPYDAVLSTSVPGTSILGTDVPGTATAGADGFSERLARNVSTLLKAESFLDKVADPAAGSYYIETLTAQLTEAAWALYNQVAAMGGYTPALTSGFVRQQVDEAYAAKLAAVHDGKVLVGVTRFRHDETGAVIPTPATDDIPAPGLPNRRLSATFE